MCIRDSSRTFVRVFLAQIEHAMASVGCSRQPSPATADAEFPMVELSLLDDEEVSDDATLDNMASRMEARNSLGLQLLGLRFGVLAGSPALEGEALPLGCLLYTSRCV